MNTDVVVVGGGVMGLATGCELERLGADVIVLEQFGVGTRRGSSHGASRVFRVVYDDPLYIRLAQRALPLWYELEARTGRTFLRTTGLIGPIRAAEGQLQVLEELNVAYEVVAAADAAARFSGVRVPGNVLYQGDGGVISADETIRAMREQLSDAVHEGVRAVRIAETKSSVEVTGDDREISASTAVLCCGPYAPELLGQVGIDLPLIPTREQIAYFAPRSGSLDGVPIFNDPGEPHVYGLPTHALGAYKIAEHGTGPAIDPRTDKLETDASVTARLVEHAVTYLPGFDPTPAGVEVCMYENTPDRDFVIDRVGRIVVGAGFSGHGFKFAPLVGRLLAELAVGKEPDVPLERFALDRASLRGDGFDLRPAR